ncbi:MAG TPA: serine/threonine-protein kinase [Polyangiales bacterium]|nr:serine/threonine-protein kinase [Polyangiales bacterium]
MVQPTLIGPVPRSTPASGADKRSRHELPADLLREASHRLGVVSLVCGVLWFVGALIGRLSGGGMVARDDYDVLRAPDAISAGVIATSIALFVYSRRSTRDPRFIFDLGLAYMVLISFAMGQMFHWRPLPAHTPVSPMISWIGPLLVMFAAIMPTTPGKTLVAGLFAASMNPLGMLIAKARGHWDFGPNIRVLVMHYPDYMLVGVAVAISHIVTGLGEHVSRAREMGSYRLGELLGRGGMGEVYRARHRMLARPAAIKLIRREESGAGSGPQSQVAMQRFRREAEVVASLRSPHTVAVYDFGTTDDHTLYLVMELLEGMDLEIMISEHGKLPPARVIHIVLQVLASLEEAHARGLVHRDIKPANIHVGRVGVRHDFVKVLDFGLAKILEPTPDAVLQTAAGAVPGTPAYMAPETALAATIDGRADLYALGCVMYFALTGELVFEASSALQMLAKHVHQDPDPPSRHSDAPIPSALDAVVLACLSKQPEARPPSAAAMADALRGIEIEPWSQVQAEAWWAARGQGAPPMSSASASS